jgi:hypothetical protein
MLAFPTAVKKVGFICETSRDIKLRRFSGMYVACDSSQSRLWFMFVYATYRRNLTTCGVHKLIHISAAKFYRPSTWRCKTLSTDRADCCSWSQLKIDPTLSSVSARLRRRGTRRRMGGEMKAQTGEWSGYPAWLARPRSIVSPEQYKCYQLTSTPRMPVVTQLSPPWRHMDSSVSPKDKIWFLRVCHII